MDTTMRAASNRWIGYLAAVSVAAACTALGLAMTPRVDPANIGLVYALGVVLVSLRYSRGPSIAASVVSTLAFNWFFVPPRFTLAVDDPQYLLAFGVLLSVGMVVSDLTERGRRQARAQAQLQLEAETERVRSTLLASISHDLRTPLAVLSGASSTLAAHGEEMSPHDRQALAQDVLRQSTALAGRVAKLLQMTRLEQDGLAIHRDWADVSEIVGTVLGRLSERLAAHRVIVDLPPSLPLVRVDATLIDQALSNLIENAAQHTPEGTVIRVRADAGDGTMLTLSVEDFGPGLPEGDEEKVFAKFHHGDAAGGVGLGLSICRAIVRLHGGNTWAEPMSGGGIAFRMSLPIEPAPELPPADPR